MTLGVFVTGVEPSTPRCPREASLRSDLALMASKKRDQSLAGNHLLALEVDEAPFDRVEVNAVSTDASNAVGVDICCCDGHLTISPTLISAEDRSDSLGRLNGGVPTASKRPRVQGLTIASQPQCAMLRLIQGGHNGPLPDP